MNQQKEVNLVFINKEGEEKHVKFWMDKHTYEILFDKSISEEIRQQYLVDEYHEYEKNRYYARKFVPFDVEFAEAMNLIEATAISNEEQYDIDFTSKEINDAIKKLNIRQQEMIRLYYWEGKSQKELSEIYGVGKQAINNALNRIYKSLKKILKKN